MWSTPLLSSLHERVDADYFTPTQDVKISQQKNMVFLPLLTKWKT